MPRLLLLLAALLLALLGACQIDADADTQADATPAHRTAQRCQGCGRIESKREILPGTFEYILRMPDGSRSTFREELPASWRVGERVGVIAGAPSPLH